MYTKVNAAVPLKHTVKYGQNSTSYIMWLLPHTHNKKKKTVKKYPVINHNEKNIYIYVLLNHFVISRN